MAEVKVAHFTVVVAGVSEEVHNTKDAHDSGKWRIRVDELVISYEWDRLVQYWRVVQSTARGRSVGNVKGPTEYTWPHGDAGKPAWVVALEHTHYPQRTVEKRERVL